MAYAVPKISQDFFCIVDRDSPELAAVIVSYLFKQDEYLPMFEFPHATIEKPDIEDEYLDEHIITRLRSDEFNVLVGNALGKNGGCGNLILAGLSKEQKSYLKFLDSYNVIEIPSVNEVDFLLGGFAGSKAQTINCREDLYEIGLMVALRDSALLHLDNNTELEDTFNSETDGIIIVEHIDVVSEVIAINYAVTVGAKIVIVDPLTRDEDREILYLMEEWKSGLAEAYNTLSEKINSRISGIDFSSYNYASFFTAGLPYCLIIKNVIPCTFIHLMCSPDLFIFNNILYENSPKSTGGVVFSPQLFKDEETTFVSNRLNAEKLYVRDLIGEEASVYGIDMHIKLFPFDIFHICSHGGEVNGTTVSTEFVDRSGKAHTVEYDVVLSLAPSKGEKLIPVSIKNFWRKFDGLRWKSPELKALKYPGSVFIDMQLALRRLSKEKKLVGVRKNIIADSTAIKCSDFNYQAMFQVVAGNNTSPIVFNNSCWSWCRISDSFLNGGVRGYVGTLWAIDNEVAVNFAKVFYENVFSETVPEVLYKANSQTKGTSSEDIYLYFGLHFSTLAKGKSAAESRHNVFITLLKSFYQWHDKSNATKSAEMKEKIGPITRWLVRQLEHYFKNDYFRMRLLKMGNRK